MAISRRLILLLEIVFIIILSSVIQDQTSCFTTNYAGSYPTKITKILVETNAAFSKSSGGHVSPMYTSTPARSTESASETFSLNTGTAPMASTSQTSYETEDATTEMTQNIRISTGYEQDFDKHTTLPILNISSAIPQQGSSASTVKSAEVQEYSSTSSSTNDTPDVAEESPLISFQTETLTNGIRLETSVMQELSSPLSTITQMLAMNETIATESIGPEITIRTDKPPLEIKLPRKNQNSFELLLAKETKISNSSMIYKKINISDTAKERIGKKHRKTDSKTHKHKNSKSNHSKGKGGHFEPRNRLPTSVVPVHYVLRIQPELSGDFLVKGSVEIELEVREATHRVRLHIADMKIKKSTVKVTLMKGHKTIPIKNIRANLRRKNLSLKVSRRLKPGRAYILSMDYSFTMKNEPQGLYKTSYVTADEKRRWIAETHFSSANARRAFPCFDETETKATFDVHIAHQENMRALSNMPVVRSYRIEELPNLVWDQFATTPKVSTYQLSFAVMDFAHARNKDNANDTLLRVWTSKQNDDESVLLLKFASASLNFFGKYFGVKYPLPKLDIIVSPERSVPSVSNWGFITFRKISTMAKNGTFQHEKSIAKSIAFQVAKQWFGNLVSFEKWEERWLNEAFATYLSHVAVNEIEPSWNVLGYFVNTLQEAMAVDCFHSTDPALKALEINTKNADELANKKGSLILRMVKHFLTEDTFKKGIANYLRQFSFKNSEEDDLWGLLTKAAKEDGSLPVGVPLKTVIDTWLQQPGFPVINVIRRHNGSALLSQNSISNKPLVLGPFLFEDKFTFDSGSERYGYNDTWWIPITFTTENGSSFKHTRAQTWLRQGVSNLKVTGLPPVDQWVIFNLQVTGYYRVNYDSITWRLLTEQLVKDRNVIHVSNRAQLIDDAMNLAKTGTLSYDITLKLLSYLRNETLRLPWLSGLRNLHYIMRMMRRTKDYGALKAFLVSLVEPLIQSLGWDVASDDIVEKSLLRTDLKKWACYLDHPICISKVDEYFNEWKNKSVKFRYESDIDETIFCTGVRNGGEELWNVIWDISQRTRDVHRRNSLLKVLACSKQIWILSRYLQAAVDPASGFSLDVIQSIYETALDTAVGDYVAWDAVKMSWSTFGKYRAFKHVTLPAVLDIVVRSFNTEFQLEQLESLETAEVLANKSFGTGKQVNSNITSALKRAKVTTNRNINWFTNNYESIVQWLSENDFNSKLLNVQ